MKLYALFCVLYCLNRLPSIGVIGIVQRWVIYILQLFATFAVFQINYNDEIIFRDDGKDGLKIYTDPDYFFNLWREAIQKETREAKEKRREQRRRDRKATHNMRRQEKVTIFSSLLISRNVNKLSFVVLPALLTSRLSHACQWRCLDPWVFSFWSDPNWVPWEKSDPDPKSFAF